MKVTTHGAAQSITDIDTDAVPPVWPIDPSSMAIEDGVYELRTVPVTSIVMVTNRTIKVRSSVE